MAKKARFIIGIDVGTRWNAICLFRNGYCTNSKIDFGPDRIKDTPRTYEEFCLMIESKMFIRTLIETVSALEIDREIGWAFIEVPDRKIAKKQNKLQEANNANEVMRIVTYWRRWLETLSGFIMVELVDSLKWQRALLPKNVRGRHRMEAATIKLAGKILASNNQTYWSGDSHSSDAVCIMFYGGFTKDLFVFKSTD